MGRLWSGIAVINEILKNNTKFEYKIGWHEEWNKNASIELSLYEIQNSLKLNYPEPGKQTFITFRVDTTGMKFKRHPKSHEFENDYKKVFGSQVSDNEFELDEYYGYGNYNIHYQNSHVQKCFEAWLSSQTVVIDYREKDKTIEYIVQDLAHIATIKSLLEFGKLFNVDLNKMFYESSNEKYRFFKASDNKKYVFNDESLNAPFEMYLYALGKYAVLN